MQICGTIDAPRRSSFMGAAIVLFTMTSLSLAFLLPQLGFTVKLSVIGGLIGLAILSGDGYAGHAVLLTALLLIPGALIPMFRVWPLSFLGPLVLYGGAVWAIPPLRHSIGWVRRGTIDRNVTLLIMATVLVSSLSLVGWVLWIKPDINAYLAMVPVLPLWVYPFEGLGFALVNAAMEEIVFRGIFMEAVDSALGAGYGSLCIQAVPFAALHYLAGFPNGLSGLVMTFAYGVMLGAIRRMSRGMLAPLATHMAADMTIFSIVFWLFFKLQSGS
jgi:membrane protease YdiL (CAAX protease family)